MSKKRRKNKAKLSTKNSRYKLGAKKGGHVKASASSSSKQPSIASATATDAQGKKASAVVKPVEPSLAPTKNKSRVRRTPLSPAAKRRLWVSSQTAGGLLELIGRMGRDKGLGLIGATLGLLPRALTGGFSNSEDLLNRLVVLKDAIEAGPDIREEEVITGHLIYLVDEVLVEYRALLRSGDGSAQALLNQYREAFSKSLLEILEESPEQQSLCS